MGIDDLVVLSLPTSERVDSHILCLQCNFHAMGWFKTGQEVVRAWMTG